MLPTVFSAAAAGRRPAEGRRNRARNARARDFLIRFGLFTLHRHNITLENVRDEIPENNAKPFIYTSLTQQGDGGGGNGRNVKMPAKKVDSPVACADHQDKTV